MNPGDIIEWVYKSSCNAVDCNERLWSSTMERCVPIGSELTHTLVSIVKEQICWLNERGLFTARANDVFGRPIRGSCSVVFPRKKA